MKIFPTNEYILCQKINESSENINIQGFMYESEQLQRYIIMEMSYFSDDRRNLFNIGDIIISNSIPTKIKDGNDEYFLIKLENVASKIV